jgi:hypothetical protein
MNKDRFHVTSYVWGTVSATALLIISGLSSPYVFGGEMMPQDRKGRMMDEMMSGRVPGLIPDQLPEPTSLGASLLIRYCAQCHNLPSPATHSAEEWPEVVQRMDRHMSMMEGMGRRDMMRVKRPTEDENEQIIQYLQAHGLKPFSADSVPSPGSSGAKLFQKTCTQCHVLPDIKLHTSDEWPGVVERMRMNMKVIGKKVITDMERDEIVNYLKEHAP